MCFYRLCCILSYVCLFNAGKSVWGRGLLRRLQELAKNMDRVVQKYCSHHLYLMVPKMSMDQAQRLLEYADEHWSDVKGTFCVEHGLR